MTSHNIARVKQGVRGPGKDLVWNTPVKMLDGT